MKTVEQKRDARFWPRNAHLRTRSKSQPVATVSPKGCGILQGRESGEEPDVIGPERCWPRPWEEHVKRGRRRTRVRPACLRHGPRSNALGRRRSCKRLLSCEAFDRGRLVLDYFTGRGGLRISSPTVDWHVAGGDSGCRSFGAISRKDLTLRLRGETAPSADLLTLTRPEEIATQYWRATEWYG
ncbi:hypothetical protein LZ30DRAFT_256229 [Colletotrichum cereale]|nr:hypothetical protein LZ30DRAFT_256229 [Colletotrichum cereale]